MHFCLPATKPINEHLPHVGIAIRSDGAHIGILYRRNAKDVYFCHLADHCDLRNEPSRPDYFWLDCCWLIDDEISGVNIAAKLVNLNKSSKLPYGFEFEPTCFNRNLRYKHMPVGFGFTCATFIIAVFHSLSYPIIDFHTWQKRPDDANWQSHALGLIISKDPIAAVHAAKHIGSFRYRPSEVAAAATACKVPIDFGTAIGRAQCILDDLSMG